MRAYHLQLHWCYSITCALLHLDAATGHSGNDTERGVLDFEVQGEPTNTTTTSQAWPYDACVCASLNRAVKLCLYVHTGLKAGVVASKASSAKDGALVKRAAVLNNFITSDG